MKDPVYYGPHFQIYKGFSFGVERIKNIYSELRVLNEHAWDETEKLYIDEPFDPCYGWLSSSEENGRVVVFTVRDSLGTLVGSSSFLVGPDYTSQKLIVANDMTTYITDSCRTGWLAQKLVKFVIEYFRRSGVDYVYMGDKSPAGGKNLAPIFKRAGFKPIAVQYVYNLGESDGQ